MNDSLLGGVRALDLTGESGYFCGKILGELGADVVKIERPGGDASRHIGPFFKNVPGPERCLYWLAHNTNKRSITLNIHRSQGQALLKRLAAKADFLIESFPPGHLARLGLGYDEMAVCNPSLIYISISHFGQTGPYKDYKGCDLVDMAMGGIMALTGDSDRPPVTMGMEQAYIQAGAHAAAGALIAHYHRDLTGEGQRVDVSVRESALRMSYRDLLHWEAERIKGRRDGNFYYRGALRTSQLWRCKDGYVAWLALGGQHGAREWQAWARWMADEGLMTKLLELDWPQMDIRTVTQSEWDSWEEVIRKFLLTHTMDYLEAGALQRGIRLNAARTVAEVAGFEQLEARGFWRDLAHPMLDTVLRYPGPLFASDLPARGVRAPQVGEHNHAVFHGELGLSVEEIDALTAANVI